MIIGEEAAVGELWAEASRRLPEPREDRPRQPVFVLDDPPEAGGSGLRAATPADLERLLPACALAHEEELGVDPLARDAEGFRWRTRSQIDDRRSWLWLEDDVILFKARRPRGRRRRCSCNRCGSILRRDAVATRRVRSATSAASCSSARLPSASSCGRRNEAALALYRRIGMRHVLDYRSLVF
jgi:hypothetical protein